MSRTIRWWNKHKNYIHLNESKKWLIDNYPRLNPHYFKHELKIVRIKIHRSLRRKNKVNLQKGYDIEPEQKTNGWITH